MKLKNLLSENFELGKVHSDPRLNAFARVNEADDDKYVHIGYGKYKQKGKENDSDAPTFKKDDNGKYVPTKGNNAGKGGDGSAADSPKVNIFDKPKEQPAKKKGFMSKIGDKLGKALDKINAAGGVEQNKKRAEVEQKQMGAEKVHRKLETKIINWLEFDNKNPELKDKFENELDRLKTLKYRSQGDWEDDNFDSFEDTHSKYEAGIKSLYNKFKQYQKG